MSREQLYAIDENLLGEAVENPIQTMEALGGLSLYEFLQVFWEEVAPDKLELNWHMELLCEELETIAERVSRKEKKAYDLIINIPPGTTKTIICMIMFPAWCFTKWYWMQFICASHSMTIALKSATKCRDLVKSDKYQAMFPQIGIKEDQDTKSDFRVIKKEYVHLGRVPRQKTGGGRFTTSVGSGIAGFHGHINMIDDPLDPQEAVSDADIETANYWMDNVIPMRKVDKKVTVQVLIMQRVHQNDPTGHELNKDKKIKHICLPGEIRNYAEFVKPENLIKNYKDNLLDPVRMDWETLKEMEVNLGQYGFAGQVGQNPTPPGGGMFKVKQFRLIDQMSSMTNVVQMVRYWDKAGTTDAGAFTVGVKMYKMSNGTYVVADVVRGQWSSEVRERTIRQTAESDGEDVMVYHEQEPGSGGKESAEGTTRNLAGYYVQADKRGGKTDGNKIQRADQYSVQVNDGNITMLRAVWNHEFIEEHRFFPFSTYKDQVDAAAGAFNKLTGKRQAKAW